MTPLLEFCAARGLLAPEKQRPMLSAKHYCYTLAVQPVGGKVKANIWLKWRDSSRLSAPQRASTRLESTRPPGSARSREHFQIGRRRVERRTIDAQGARGRDVALQLA
jgi:hypothetical protein